MGDGVDVGRVEAGDVEQLAERLAEFVKPYQEAVGWASSGTEAVERVGARAHETIVSDISMPEMTGIDSWEAVRAAHPRRAHSADPYPRPASRCTERPGTEASPPATGTWAKAAVSFPSSAR